MNAALDQADVVLGLEWCDLGGLSSPRDRAAPPRAKIISADETLPVARCASIGWSWYYGYHRAKMRVRTAMPTSGSSRRAFIKTIGAVAVATCGRAAAAKAQDYKPQDQKKLTQAAARYQDHPKENQSCGNCPYFVFPNSCVVVEGEISAFGWCPMYTTFPPRDRGGHA